MRLLVIFLVFLISLFTSHFSLSTSVYAHSSTQIVKITANGFEPRDLSLDTNSTIIFINEDKTPHWPASDIHPTHEIYPEFDPKKPINPGESWPFKPKRVGTFKFHDHLFPHFRGVMTINGEPGQLSSPKSPLVTFIQNLISTISEKVQLFFGQKKAVLGIKDISKLSPNEQFQYLKDMAKQKSVEITWQYLKDTFKGQGGNSGNIHDLAHLMGSLIYENKGFQGLTVCTPDFAFGCYHGFLDKAFEKNLNDLEKAEEACGKLGSGGPLASCIHGIGHGVASFYSTVKLNDSLNSCKRLSQAGQQYCFDGVFMEFVRSAPDSLFKKDDPLYPCNALEQEFGPVYSFSCGRNQPSLLMSRFKVGFDQVAEICAVAESLPFKQACFDSLGFSLASSGNPETIISGCQKIGLPEFVARCSKAAAGELIFQDVPGWQENAPKVCSSLSPEYLTQCQEYLDNLIKEYGRGSKSFSFKKNGEDSNYYLRDQLKICYDNGGANDCYKYVAQIFFDQFGLKESLNLLAQNENYPEVYARCHEVTHFLSRSEYEKLGSIAAVYAGCNSTCHGGCYHGTLEAYLKEKNLDTKGVTRQFSRICGKEEDYNAPIVFNECLHGLGHAAMYVTEADLPLSLSFCDLLPSQDGKERCYSGAFMENSSSSTNRDHPGKFVKADDPFYPCNSLEEKYLRLCWRYQSSYFSIISNQDWNKVISLCKQVPGKYQEECFRTIGTNQVGFTSDMKKMEDDCNLVPEEFQDICIAGVVSSFAYRFVGDSSKMINFCSIVEMQEKEACFKQIGLGVLDWTGDSQLASSECSKIPDTKYSSWCISAIKT